MLLRPLPYENPDRLVLAGAELRKRDIKDGVFSDANFFDFRNVAKTMFEGFATVYTGRTDHAEGGWRAGADPFCLGYAEFLPAAWREDSLGS